MPNPYNLCRIFLIIAQFNKISFSVIFPHFYPFLLVSLEAREALNKKCLDRDTALTTTALFRTAPRQSLLCLSDSATMFQCAQTPYPSFLRQCIAKLGAVLISLHNYLICWWPNNEGFCSYNLSMIGLANSLSIICNYCIPYIKICICLELKKLFWQRIGESAAEVYKVLKWAQGRKYHDTVPLTRFFLTNARHCWVSWHCSFN